MRIREQLRPYIMDQYQAAAQTGAPVMRPLFYDFWEDPVAATVDDQMMFGPDYLVAPVLVENATERFVCLLRTTSIQNTIIMLLFSHNQF